MRRRAAEKRERIFARALAVAREVGRLQGLGGLTVRRIARRTGCSVGTIYNVFGNLDTLILHLNARTLDEIHAALSAVELADDPETAIRQLTETYHRYSTTNARLWSILFEHIWPEGYVLPDWYAAKISDLLNVLADTLKPLVPDATDAERRQAAALLWSGLHGINSLAVSGKIGLISSESVVEMSEFLIRIFVEGLPRNIAQFKTRD